MNKTIENLQNIGATAILLPHFGKGDVQHAPFWWCRKQGMVLGQDFYRESTSDGMVYAFTDPKIATQFALKWT